MPFCPNCGNKATQDMLYCPHCGNKLAAADSGVGTDATRNHAIVPETKNAQAPVPLQVKKSKLYRQWVEHAGLPPEPTQQATAAKGIPAPSERKRREDMIVYLFMAAIILILAAGLAILVAKLW